MSIKIVNTFLFLLGKEIAEKFCKTFTSKDTCKKNKGCAYASGDCTSRDPFYRPISHITRFQPAKKEAELKVENIKAEYNHQNSTLIFSAKNLQCLKKNVTVTYIVPKVPSKIVSLTDQMISLSSLMSKQHSCVEYQEKLEISSVNASKVWEGHFNFTVSIGLPKVVADGMLEFTIHEEMYSKCWEDVSILLNCTGDEGSRTVFVNKGLQVEQSKIQGKSCWAKAYIDSQYSILPGDHDYRSLEYKKFSVCFTDTGLPCAEANIRSIYSLVASGTGIGGALIMAFVAVVLASKIGNRGNVKYSLRTEFAPSHIIFHNTDTLSEDLDTAAALQNEIHEEYKKLEAHVRNHIEPHETSNVAKSDLNSRRNRYQDMVPYDSNLLTLSRETGAFMKISKHVYLHSYSRNTKV